MAQKKVGGIIRKARTYMAHSRGAGRPGGARSGLGNPGLLYSQYETNFFGGDTHAGGQLAYLDGNGLITNPNVRQIDAFMSILGRPFHTLEGVVEAPLAKFQLGDAVHEDTQAPEDEYVNYPYDFTVRGNHDQPPLASLIVARHGSLEWGVKVGSIWFQALTENYIAAPNNSFPPTAARIAAVKAQMLATRPPGERTVFLMHRSLTNSSGGGSPESGGYQAEWDVDSGAKDALEDLCNSFNTLCMIQGHNHYSYRIIWRGIRIYSPGSVAQAPMLGSPPWGTAYPESFLVLRVHNNWFDIGCYCFGFLAIANNQVWAPGTWEWSERVMLS